MLLFFFNDTATTEIYTLSLHDALPISPGHADAGRSGWSADAQSCVASCCSRGGAEDSKQSCTTLPSRSVRNVIPVPEIRRDRKSTRLNSSHANISYAVFCLKKKKHL